MPEKKDFMSALAEQVEARKRGENISISTVDDFTPAEKTQETPVVQEPVQKPQPKPVFNDTPAVNKPAQPKAEPAETKKPEVKKEEAKDTRPASFKEETFTRIEKPKRTLSPVGIGILGVLAALTAFLIWWFFIAAHITVPNFVGKSINEVSSWARQNKMETTAIAMSDSVYSLEYAKDIVVAQSVEPGKKVKPDTPITITVSKGPDPEEEIAFPDIKNMTQSEISDWIKENQLAKTKVTTQYSTIVESGNVISYEVKNGSESEFKRGTTLNIVCSKGPAPAGQVTVENFKGKSYAEVENWARTKKVNLVKLEEFSKTVDAGMVISQDVSAGSAMNEGATLTVIVSKGKGVNIPNLVGYSAEQLEAWRANKDNNVTVVTKSVYNEALGGTVISQSLTPGSVVESGSVLELTISKYLPILETNSRQWLGKDYLELKYWVDEINAQGGALQAGEYIGDRVCSDEYPTPGSIINYTCEYGTMDSNGSYEYSSGCERPLNLYSRIGYQVSTGGCKVTPTPAPTPEPKQIVLTNGDLVDLATIMSFCDTNGLNYGKPKPLSSTDPEAASWKDKGSVKVVYDNKEYFYSDPFTKVITEGSSLTIYYLTDIGEDVTVECWDGSTAKTEAECPVRVECADGSFVHDKSDCKE
ncbi:MAG: PASTA domain-containing protein [Solobacterium sp.]|nr:PASTA domain-containing protein [Solobacterium sp.]